MIYSAKSARNYFIHAEGQAWPLAIKRVRGARYMRLSYQPLKRQVRLTLPYHARIQDGLAFAESRAGWLSREIARAGVRCAFAPGMTLTIFGVPHIIHHMPGRRGSVRQEAGMLYVNGEEAFVARRITDWLKAEAQKELSRLAAIHAEALGVRVRRVGVRDTSSRWGSCSTNGHLSFSWRLILAPHAVLNYVVAHEVAHLKEMNHSARFWRLVSTLCPDYEVSERWLSVHGGTLYTIG